MDQIVPVEIRNRALFPQIFNTDQVPGAGHPDEAKLEIQEHRGEWREDEQASGALRADDRGDRR